MPMKNVFPSFGWTDDSFACSMSNVKTYRLEQDYVTLRQSNDIEKLEKRSEKTYAIRRVL